METYVALYFKAILDNQLFISAILLLFPNIPNTYILLSLNPLISFKIESILLR